ncbi:FAD-dependent oxidoreductase, partial [Streptomyces sp. SB3404]|nr:FAD-dependent oxidoreductase [Streptomyces boncukensis]
MIRCAIVGTGDSARRHARVLRRVRSMALTHVVVAPGGRLSAPDMFDSAAVTVTDRLADVLEDPRVDAVLVCSPPHTHLDSAESVLEADKHLVVEQPVGLRPERIPALERRARERELVAMVPYHFRFVPPLMFLRRRVADGEFGRIAHAYHRMYRLREGAGEWLWDEERSGGVIMETLVHGIDQLVWMLGTPPEAVAAMTHAGRNGVATAATVLLRFPDGAVGTVEGSWLGDPQVPFGSLDLTGTEGSVAFDRGRFASYSACGIPYWIGGDVASRDALIARTPEEHRARGIALRLRTEVTELDLDRQRVRARERDSGAERWVGFDHLVLATGARPVRPELPGIDAPGVHGVQTLDDGQALLDALDGGGHGGGARRAVVVGGGYIGVEMAEALLRRGWHTTVVDRGAQPMATLDPDMGALVHEAMCGLGIETVREAAVTGILTDSAGRARGVATADAEYPADLVVLGLGVAPETTLARAAGLPLGESGGLRTDLAMRVRGTDNIWSGGDCVEVLNLVSGRPQHVPLGTHANKHGQVIGRNVGGDYATFPGVVGTAVSKVCDLEIGRTGLLERHASAVGLRFVTVTVESTSRAGYYPGARPMRVK